MNEQPAQCIKRKAEDAAIFVVYAILSGYQITSLRNGALLAKWAAEWATQHGTPTQSEVARFLEHHLRNNS